MPAEASAIQAEIYPQIALVAEDVRWKLSDIPWHSLEPSRASPALKSLVRDMAFFELATYSATQRFLQAFPEDHDFTQWLSVWFYEETRHPSVLMKWLALVGETWEPSFVARGRVSSPFVKSKTGTLAFNILSEVTAAAAYLSLAASVEEPLLKSITRRIGSDEARHAATFYSYARRRIAAAERPEREILDVLKVLHFWLNESENVTHPVSQTMQKARALQEELGVKPNVDVVIQRSCRILGELVGIPLHGPEDVARQLAEATTRLHAVAAS